MSNGCYKVRYQIIVNTYGGGFYLFEQDGVLPVPPGPGMLLRNIPGIPNVAGPDAGFDNVIRRVVISGAGKEKTDATNCEPPVVLVQLQGFRSPTETIGEIKEKMTGWEYIERVDNHVTETGPEDILDG